MIGTALLAMPLGLFAQAGRGGGRGGRGGAQAPQTPQAAAPVDLTGYWVSIITEDWRYRMVMPAKGDFQGVPMTPAARQIADQFDPAKPTGDACAAYGAPVALRNPTRLHITWQDPQTLKIETDTGKQTRLLHFGDWNAPAGPPTIQGNSVAEWQRGGGRGASGNGWLKVDTTHFTPGLLRKNGIPYSDAASLEEYFDLVKMGGSGDPLLVVTTITTDPKYLRQPFIITSHFKKEANDAKWHPTDCSSTW